MHLLHRLQYLEWPVGGQTRQMVTQCSLLTGCSPLAASQSAASQTTRSFSRRGAARASSTGPPRSAHRTSAVLHFVLYVCVLVLSLCIFFFLSLISESPSALLLAGSCSSSPNAATASWKWERSATAAGER